MSDQALAAAPAEESAKTPRLLLPSLVFAAYGLYFASLSPQISLLSIRVARIDPAHKTVGLSAVILIGAIVSILSLPLFGALSDRTRGNFGRRRPWLIGGAAAGLLGLIVAGLVPNLTGVAIGWAIGSLGIGAAFAGFLPLIPELVAEHLRARLSGLIGFIVSLAVLTGVVIGSKLVHHQVLMLAIPAVVIVIAAGQLAYVIRGADVVPELQFPAYNLKAFISSYWLRTNGDRDFRWNWVSRFLIGLAYVGVQTYATYFLTDSVGMNLDHATARYATMTAASTPVSVVFFLLSGFLSDRYGRRKVFVCIGGAVLTAGLVVAAVTQSLGGFFAGWLILSAGQAIYLTVDIAIAAQVVPDPAHSGKAMSVYQVATLLPNVAAPIVAVVVLAAGGKHNYTLFFAVLAVVAALAALAVLKVRRIR